MNVHRKTVLLSLSNSWRLDDLKISQTLKDFIHWKFVIFHHDLINALFSFIMQFVPIYKISVDALVSIAYLIGKYMIYLQTTIVTSINNVTVYSPKQTIQPRSFKHIDFTVTAQ